MSDLIPSFIFGGENTAIKTPEDLARKRALVDALLTQESNSPTPRNLGEGLGAIGKALMVRQARQGLQSNVADVQAGQDKLSPIITAAMNQQAFAQPAQSGAMPAPSAQPVASTPALRPYDGQGSNVTNASPIPAPVNLNMPAALTSGQQVAVPPPQTAAQVPQGAASGQLAALIDVANRPEFAFASPIKQKMVTDLIQTLQSQNTPAGQLTQLQLGSAKRQQEAINAQIAALPPDQQSLALANPDEYIKNLYAIQAGNRNIGYVDKLTGGSNNPPPPQGQAVAGHPVVAGQVSQNQPPQDVSGGPNIDMNAIPIPDSVRNEARLAAIGKDGVAGAAKIISDYRQHQADQMRQDYYQSPAFLAKKASSEAVATGVTKDALASHDSAQSAVGDIGIINEGRRLLDSGIYSGRFSDYQTQFNAALEKAGVSSPDPKVSNTQAYAALMGNRVGNIIKQFGSGTGLSDNDRVYAERIAGGQTTVDEQSIRRMLDIGEKLDRITIDRYQKSFHPLLQNAAPNDPYKIEAPAPYVKAQQQPPMQGAQQAPDGKWYVQQNGKFFEVQP